MTDWKAVLFAGIATGIFSTAALAQEALPEPVQSGNATYVTGGVGDEERAALESTQQSYNLRILNAEPSGAFVSDTDLSIIGKEGELIRATAGPLFYAQLPAGTYTVEATHEGQTKKQKVTVGGGKSSKLVLSWK